MRLDFHQYGDGGGMPFLPGFRLFYIPRFLITDQTPPPRRVAQPPERRRYVMRMARLQMRADLDGQATVQVPTDGGQLYYTMPLAGLARGEQRPVLIRAARAYAVPPREIEVWEELPAGDFQPLGRAVLLLTED